MIIIISLYCSIFNVSLVTNITFFPLPLPPSPAPACCSFIISKVWGGEHCSSPADSATPSALLADVLSAGRPSFPAPPSLSAQAILIQGSIPGKLKDNPSHLTSHQHIPILVDESLVDSPSWETRLMLGQRGPSLECRSLTASLTDPALVPALRIIPRWKRPKQPRTHCFWPK